MNSQKATEQDIDQMINQAIKRVERKRRMNSVAICLDQMVDIFTTLH